MCNYVMIFLFLYILEKSPNLEKLRCNGPFLVHHLYKSCCRSCNKEEMLWKHFWENRRLLLDRNIGLPPLDQIFLLSGNPYFHTLPTQPSLISVIFLDYDPMLCFTMLSARKSELLLRYFLIGGVQEQPRIRLSWVFWYWSEITNWLW